MFVPPPKAPYGFLVYPRLSGGCKQVAKWAVSRRVCLWLESQKYRFLKKDLNFPNTCLLDLRLPCVWYCMTAYEVYLPLFNTHRNAFTYLPLLLLWYDQRSKKRLEKVGSNYFFQKKKREKKKSIWLSINLLMTASGLIWHIWYQAQTEVLCWDKLEREQLRARMTWGESVSVCRHADGLGFSTF